MLGILIEVLVDWEIAIIKISIDISYRVSIMATNRDSHCYIDVIDGKTVAYTACGINGAALGLKGVQRRECAEYRVVVIRSASKIRR